MSYHWVSIHGQNDGFKVFPEAECTQCFFKEICMNKFISVWHEAWILNLGVNLTKQIICLHSKAVCIECFENVHVNARLLWLTRRDHDCEIRRSLSLCLPAQARHVGLFRRKPVMTVFAVIVLAFREIVWLCVRHSGRMYWIVTFLSLVFAIWCVGCS